MSVFRMIAGLGLAGFISTAAYSAHFVGEQIAYLHQKLSHTAEASNLAADWPATEATLPKLEDQLAGHLRTTYAATLSDFSPEPTVLLPSR